MTVQMYANLKKIPLKSANVEVTIDRESKEESHFTRKISFEGDITEEQKTKLLEIANKCPIHKILSSKVTITTT
jgi:putative redox protein